MLRPILDCKKGATMMNKLRSVRLGSCFVSLSLASCGYPILLERPDGGGMADTAGMADAGDGSSSSSGPTCFGNGLIRNLCLASPPTGVLTLSTSINTVTVGKPNCTSIEPQSGGPSLCVIAADSIRIDAGQTLTAIGANPLVLIANTTISIGGTLDVASHGSGGAAAAGAQMACGAATITGANGSGGDG